MTGHQVDPGGAEATSDGEPPEGADAASGRRRSVAFELFILGELMDGPHHGYLLHDILTRLLGPYRQISWAAIYPLIRRLEREGLIAPEATDRTRRGAEPNGRRRQRFGITEAGRRRFRELMLAPAESTAEYREVFTIKLTPLRHLVPDEQRAVLADGRNCIQRERDYLRRVFTARSTTAHLPDDQRQQIFRMMRFRLASVEAELRWVEDELTRLGEKG